MPLDWQLKLPKPGEAYYDPGMPGEEDSNWMGKIYHLVWSKKRPGKLTFHTGERAKCKRVHYNIKGEKL